MSVLGVQAMHTTQLGHLRRFDKSIFPAMTKSPATTELRTTDADNAARAQIMSLLLENNKIRPEGSRCTLPNAEHTIQLVPGAEEKLRHQAQYRLGADKEAALNKALEKLLALGAIAPIKPGEVPPCTSPHVVAAQMQPVGWNDEISRVSRRHGAQQTNGPVRPVGTAHISPNSFRLCVP